MIKISKVFFNMAKVRASSSSRRRSSGSGKMACVSLFLVLLLASTVVQETSAQAAVGQFDWMGLLSSVLQNTFLGPFVTAINAVSGGVPNLSGALLGLTNNISAAANQVVSQNGFTSPASTPAAPAVFRREAVNFTGQTPKKVEEVDPTHDLFMEVELPQQHHSRDAASALNSSSASSSPTGAFFTSAAYHVARNATTSEPSQEMHTRGAGGGANSSATELLYARDLLNSSSSSAYPKEAPVNGSSALSSSNHVRSEDPDDADEATVADAAEEDSAQYANAPAVHARMVFKRSAAYNASHSQQARADEPAAAAAGGLPGVQNVNNLLANGALGATQLGAAGLQASSNLAAGIAAASGTLAANAANALGTLGAQQAAALNTLAANQFGQAGAALEADKAALEAAKVGAKGPQQGNEIPFPPAPQTTPKPVVYYTPSPKFYAQKPVAAVAGKAC